VHRRQSAASPNIARFKTEQEFIENLGPLWQEK
jgi:hypothetical protein